MTEPRRFISLGAGVQSSTLYLMAVAGEFGDERPEGAIFADTQWEPGGVYNWLDTLQSIGGDVIPIHRCTSGDIRATLLEANRHYRRVSAPFYVKNDNRIGALYRQCTKHFKLEPLRRATRELLGIKKGQRVPAATAVETWIGISTDEATRMKPAREAWITHRWPLIERNMSRRDCVRWLREHGVSGAAEVRMYCVSIHERCALARDEARAAKGLRRCSGVRRTDSARSASGDRGGLRASIMSAARSGGLQHR